MYRRIGFGDFDPAGDLKTAIASAQQSVGSAGIIMLAMMAGLGFLVARHSRRG